MAYRRHNQLSLARLNSLSSNQWELERFLQTDAGKKIDHKISVAVGQYMKMMEELQYMEEHLPGLLIKLEDIQKKVDKRHKNSNIATVGGCATSIVGGAMMVGGIVAAPFTLGTSIGLSAAGTAVALAGGGTTAAAKSTDFFKGRSDLKKTNDMVDKFLVHYNAAKEAYEAVNQTCQELTAMLPTLECETAKSIPVALNAVVSAAGFAIHCTRAPKQVITTGLGALTICKAAVSPTQLHAATKLALAPTRALPLTREFLTEAATVVRCASNFESSGFRLAVMSSFRAASTLIKTAGVAFAIGGIVLDAYSLISAGRELHKNKKCKVSQDISKHIQDLEKIRDGLKVLNQQLAANVKPINN